MPQPLPSAGLALLAILALPVLAPSQQLLPDGAPGITTDGGTYAFPPGAHPLAFWTEHPLDRRCRNDLLIGLTAPDGKPITPADYTLDQQVHVLGTLAGHKVVQLLLFIHPGPRTLPAGITIDPDNPTGLDTQFKTLLVQTGPGDSYRQFYGLQVGPFRRFKSAAIFGTGNNQILATYEPDGGNGGGCSDGYWWFDHRGPHPVDFDPLNSAIQQKIPPNTSFTQRCWALHPETNSLQSAAQRTDAECHACGFVGGIAATYRIHHGKAEPVSITFTPDPPGQ